MSPWPVERGMSRGRVDATALILGQLWKKFLSPINRIFKKRLMRNQNNNPCFVPIHVRSKPRSTVKIFKTLGSLCYDATPSIWVTFSYELTGSILVRQLRGPHLRT